MFILKSKEDACFKNPCANGGKCSLDAKLKPVCECPNGYGSKECDKSKFLKKFI